MEPKKFKTHIFAAIVTFAAYQYPSSLYSKTFFISITTSIDNANLEMRKKHF